MGNEVLLNPVKYFEMSLLQSRENKQFCLIYFLQNFDLQIGSRAIDKFLERKISANRLSVLIRAESRVTLNRSIPSRLSMKVSSRVEFHDVKWFILKFSVILSPKDR